MCTLFTLLKVRERPPAAGLGQCGTVYGTGALFIHSLPSKAQFMNVKSTSGEGGGGGGGGGEIPFDQCCAGFLEDSLSSLHTCAQ